jgi:GT2 family glycosyltransferase
MDLSIIIVNYRSWTSLRECLDSLKIPGDLHFSQEVVVVDNNSGDGILDRFERMYPDFSFIHNSVNGGFAYGCNTGAKNASGEYYLFLNPDTVSNSESIGKLLEEARQCKGLALISCRQFNSSGRESRAYGMFPGPMTLCGTGRALYRIINREKHDMLFREESGVIHPPWVSGSVMMMSKETFTITGGFDEDYWMYYEDTDICKRIRDAGGDIGYYTDFGIIHNHGGASRINIKTTALTKTEVIISRHVYVSKHFKGFTRFLLQNFLVLNNIITGLTTAVTGVIIFFRPKMFLSVMKFGRLTGYYLGVAINGKWISPRSVNFDKTK